MSDFVFFTGSLLLGSQFNWGLLGILTLQVYMFHVSFPKERTAIKALVYTTFLLDVLQTALSSHFAFEVLATGWGNPAAITHPPWSNVAVPVTTALVSAPVQVFFAWRIYVLKQKSRFTWAVCGLIIALSLIQSSTGIAGGIKYSVTTSLTDTDVRVIRLLGKIWLLGSIFCDVIIAVTMIIILLQYRKEPHGRIPTA
ncbi:hypothetical protein DFH09DRAFT_1048811 [Mycena vulgaris]|nr:hypothetical protein DFH09DRAFT_1048811 [Mycena vulgaris]